MDLNVSFNQGATVVLLALIIVAAIAFMWHFDKVVELIRMFIK